MCCQQLYNLCTVACKLCTLLQVLLRWVLRIWLGTTGHTHALSMLQMRMRSMLWVVLCLLLLLLLCHQLLQPCQWGSGACCRLLLCKLCRLCRPVARHVGQGLRQLNRARVRC
jgi:hypothetical protein